MARTLLLGHPGYSRRDWLKANLGERSHICLDPSEPLQSPPGRICLSRSSKVIAWRFFGGIDELRAPHVLVAGLSKLLAMVADDLVVEAPVYRPTSQSRQLLHLIVEAVQPDEILGPAENFPVEFCAIELPEAFSEHVAIAQRKAQWLKMLEECESHELMLGELKWDGIRLGSGRQMASETLDVLYMEAFGSILLVVAEGQPEDREIAKLLNHSHCSRAHIVAPDAYNGLLCSFARGNGEDFGIGVIDSIDFSSGIVRVKNSAVGPVPVPTLRVGRLRLDADGNELGEIQPWQV